MQIKHFLHTAIEVSDLGRSEHFYGQILGLERVDRGLKYPGAWYQVGHQQLHLLVAAAPVAPPHDERLGRNRHIALAVADLEAAKQALTHQGYPLQMSGSGRPAFFTQDPDGNVIEIGEG